MTKNGEKDELFYITNENYQFFSGTGCFPICSFILKNMLKKRKRPIKCIKFEVFSKLQKFS